MGPCVLNAVREYDDPNWIVGNALTRGARQDYPYDKMTPSGRGRYGGYGGVSLTMLESKQFSQIKYLRQQLMGRADVSLAELLELQAAASIADENADEEK